MIDNSPQSDPEEIIADRVRNAEEIPEPESELIDLQEAGLTHRDACFRSATKLRCGSHLRGRFMPPCRSEIISSITSWTPAPCGAGC